MNSLYLLDIRNKGHKRSGKFFVQLINSVQVINFLNVIQNISSPACKIISEYADSFGHSLYFASFTDTSNEYWLRNKFLVILRPVAFCYVILLLSLLLLETQQSRKTHTAVSREQYVESIAGLAQAWAQAWQSISKRLSGDRPMYSRQCSGHTCLWKSLMWLHCSLNKEQMDVSFHTLNPLLPPPQAISFPS